MNRLKKNRIDEYAVMEDSMDENCKNCESGNACVPFFLHENAMMHYSKANKRMLIAFIVVCITVAVIIGIFVYGNTIREKQLIDLIDKRIVEVADATSQTPPP
jgi:hypothetical protein